MKHLSGGKVTSRHTTANEVVSDIIGYLGTVNEVKKISLGMIEKVKSTSNWSVKLTDCKYYILIQARQSATTQEVRVYTSDCQKVMLGLSMFIRDQGWNLRFGKQRL